MSDSEGRLKRTEEIVRRIVEIDRELEWLEDVKRGRERGMLSSWGIDRRIIGMIVERDKRRVLKLLELFGVEKRRRWEDFVGELEKACRERSKEYGKTVELIMKLKREKIELLEEFYEVEI